MEKKGEKNSFLKMAYNAIRKLFNCFYMEVIADVTKTNLYVDVCFNFRKVLNFFNSSLVIQRKGENVSMTKNFALPDCQRIAIKQFLFIRLSYLGIGKQMMQNMCRIYRFQNTLNCKFQWWNKESVVV